MTLAALAPLLAVLALLGSGRASTLVAGMVGLICTLAAGFITARLMPQDWLMQAAIGSWMALRVVVVILAGLFFSRCLQAWSSRVAVIPPAGLTAHRPAPGATPAGEARLRISADARTLWVSCFALGPFVEAVTGFGVGYLILLAHLQRLGLSGMPLLVLGLYSQTLVPWGALAVGTVLGAQLAGITPIDMGERAALLQAPMHLGYLLLYWRFLACAGIQHTAAGRLQDLGWTAVLLAALWAANRYVDLEIAGVLACGLVVLAHEGLRKPAHGLRAGRTLPQVLHAILPLALVTGVLGFTRLPPIQDRLRQSGVWAPWPDQAALHPWLNPAPWLIACGLAVLWLARMPAGAMLRQTLAQGWRPVLVTLIFVLMAQAYVGAGFAQALAAALESVAGPAALLVVPVFAGVAGFLTGTGAASNAMLMAMVTALATQSGVSVPWLAAAQATISTNLTMLSPMRVAMGIAFNDRQTTEAALYRAARVLALPALLSGLALVAGLLWEKR